MNDQSGPRATSTRAPLRSRAGGVHSARSTRLCSCKKSVVESATAVPALTRKNTATARAKTARCRLPRGRAFVPLATVGHTSATYPLDADDEHILTPRAEAPVYRHVDQMAELRITDGDARVHADKPNEWHANRRNWFRRRTRLTLDAGRQSIDALWYRARPKSRPSRSWYANRFQRDRSVRTSFEHKMKRWTGQSLRGGRCPEDRSGRCRRRHEQGSRGHRACGDHRPPPPPRPTTSHLCVTT